MKDIPYLTHNLGARNDPKLLELQIDMGGKGLGLYWCIVEMLWENGGYLPAKYKNIAFSLPWATAEDVEHVVTGFGLFEVDGERFWSKAALERIEDELDLKAWREAKAEFDANPETLTATEIAEKYL